MDPTENAARSAGEVMEVMMADLGHARQEELPLNRRLPKYNAVSFAPTGNNGTSHIPATRKAALSKGWGKPVRDEESEQVKALVLEECPWRNNQRKDVSIPGLFSHPRRYQGQAPSHGHVRRPAPMKDNTVPLVHRPERTPHLPAPAKALPHTKKAVIKETPVNDMPIKELSKLTLRDETPVKSPIKPPVKPPIKVASTDVVEAPKPAPPAVGIAGVGLQQCDLYFEPPTAEQSVVFPYRGYCMVFPDSKNWKNQFAAKFAVELHLETAPEPNIALLHLESDGLESRVHDITDIGVPRMTIAGDKCILRSKPEAALEFCYIFGLKDQETTTLFVEAIEGIQKALEAVAARQDMATTEVVNIPAAPSTSAESLVNLEPEPQPDYFDTLDNIVEEAISTLRKSCEDQEPGEIIEPDGEQAPMFDHLATTLYEKMKGKAGISGLPFLRDGFRELLCVLFKVKTLLDHSGEGEDRAPISEATLAMLKHLEGSADEAARTVQYQAAEMIKYRANAIDVSGQIQTKHFLPPRTPSVSPPKVGQQLIFSGPYAPSNNAYAPSSQHDEEQSVPSGKTEGVVVTKPASGLSSSMYAH